ncbi:MAG: hypothetical protein BGP13_13705 [Sphingobacteriales bacterium 40-81]|nr:MAG: hypothetical protein BGP13_13705 [Sphingobacteriales bacterium 40-81]
MRLFLFLKYYYDVNKVNFVISVSLFLLFRNALIFLLSFSGFGFLISYITWHYFHNTEYYFYANAGYSKTRLILQAIILNIAFSVIIYILFR